MLEPYP